MDKKKIFTSKTIIFAALFAAISIAGVFGFADYSPGTDTVEIVNIVVAAVVVVLRLVTNKGVEL